MPYKDKEQKAAYDRANRKRHSKQALEWYYKNTFKALASSKLYAKEHPELYRKATKAWEKRNPEKQAAYRILSKAIRKGEISKPDVCDRCGKSGRIHGHHADYSKPLDVEWLCSPCHGLEHRGTS